MVKTSAARVGRGRAFAAILVSAALILSACTGLPGQPTSSPTASTPVDAASAAEANLGATACEGSDTLLCGTLTVPLDHENPEAVLATPTPTPGATAAAEPQAASLDLAVTLTEGEGARGALLLLSGGPGQPGTNVVQYFQDNFPEVAAEYQLIGIDQRGTGANAIDCPAVQREVGSSDLLSANPSAVVSCGNELEGTRQFYSTVDTVKDLEALRTALELPTWAIDGISYGTFVAEQYALAYPQAVSALVLDSVVGQNGIDPFTLTSMSETSRVLTAICAAQECTSNPAGDISKVISDGYDALSLFNTIVSLSVTDPTMPGLIDALSAARNGKWGKLDKLVAATTDVPTETIDQFSAGLHVATICTDTTMPWGDSASDPASRLGALGSAIAEIKPEEAWPYPATLAAEVGSVTACQIWPQTEFGTRASGTLPNIPILLLAGELDLSTPIAEAQKQLEITPSATLRVISGSGHAVQVYPAGQEVVTRFLVSD